MISFELTEEQRIVRATVRDFARDALQPEARKSDDAGKIDDAVLEALWSMGIVQSMAFDPAERPDAVTNALIVEELGAADASLAVAVGAALGYARAIFDQGSPRQQADLRKVLGAGSFGATAVALMEPRFGFASGRLETTATPSGDSYVICGRKSMIPLASRCGSFLVIARLDDAAAAFIVDASSQGVSVAESGGTLGLRPLQLAEVAFEDVRVPASMLLGEGRALDVQRIIDNSRVALTVIMAGMSRQVMDYVIPFVKDRRVHGAPLATRQSIAFNIADMHMEAEAMRWMAWKGAWQLDCGESATKQAQLAYTFAGQQATMIADNGLQAFGGHGYVKVNPLEMWYRNARTLSVLEGFVGV